MGQLVYTSFLGGDSGGGGGSFLDYSYNSVHPIYVADYTNGVFGHGPGGATAPTLSTTSTDLFASGDFGILNASALARLSGINSAGVGVISKVTTNTTITAPGVYFGCSEGTATSNMIRTRISNTNSRQEFAVNSGGVSQASLIYNFDQNTTLQVAWRAASNAVRFSRVNILSLNDNSATMPGSMDNAAINCTGFPDGTIAAATGAFSNVEHIIVFANPGWSDAQLQDIGLNYAPS